MDDIDFIFLASLSKQDKKRLCQFAALLNLQVQFHGSKVKGHRYLPLLMKAIGHDAHEVENVIKWLRHLLIHLEAIGQHLHHECWSMYWFRDEWNGVIRILRFHYKADGGLEPAPDPLYLTDPLDPTYYQPDNTAAAAVGQCGLDRDRNTEDFDALIQTLARSQDFQAQYRLDTNNCLRKISAYRLSSFGDILQFMASKDEESQQETQGKGKELRVEDHEN